ADPYLEQVSCAGSRQWRVNTILSLRESHRRAVPFRPFACSKEPLVEISLPAQSGLLSLQSWCLAPRHTLFPGLERRGGGEAVGALCLSRRKLPHGSYRD